MAFQKGKSGNEAGRPRLPPDVKSIRELNKVSFARLANHLLQMKLEDLVALSKDREAPVLLLMIARTMISAIEEQNERKLAFICDRLMGKPPIQISAEIEEVSTHAKIVRMIREIEDKNKGENNG